MSSTAISALSEQMRKIESPEGGFFTRIKYTPNGELLSLEHASKPIFKRKSVFDQARRDDPSPADKWDPDAIRLPPGSGDETNEDNARRAVNRAKVRAFDFIMCNPDLDAFATLTLDGDRIERTSYPEIYGRLRGWLSNRVQRRGLKYILCPEYHDDGQSIHFHMLANSGSLDLIGARTPGGFPARRKGKPVYNIADWDLGFSTAQLIPPTDGREAVAKYIFKYMGKQTGARIGGRYFLHGGDLAAPVVELCDVIPPALQALPEAFRTEFSLAEGFEYQKRYFL